MSNKATQIKQQLIEKYAEKEGRLTHNEIEQLSIQGNGFPTLGTICKYFKTTKMTEAWEEIEKSNELRLALYDKGLNDSAISDLIGISQEAVSKWRRKQGLPVNKKKRKLTDDGRMDLYKQGLTDEEIAERLGLGTLTITLWRTQQGLKTNGVFNTEMSSTPIDPPPSGRNQHNKATDNRMELYQQGLTDAEIAKAIGKSEKAILSWRYTKRLAANQPKYDK